MNSNLAGSKVSRLTFTPDNPAALSCGSQRKRVTPLFVMETELTPGVEERPSGGAEQLNLSRLCKMH